MSEPVAGAPVVVLNQLGTAAGRDIAALDPRVQVLDDPDSLPWTRAREADILLTAPRHGWREAPRTAPAGWPGRLRWVHAASVGMDYFPPWLFEVPQVSCARGVAAVPIAEFVFAALLAHSRPLSDCQVTGPAPWRSTFGRVSAAPPALLAGQTLGLVGFGAIGQAVARRALAFDMRVLALRRSQAPSDVGGVQAAASLHEVMAESDHVVLALPITPATHHMIDAAALAQARAGLHLINIARGALVDHDALLAALDVGRLSAATLDVTEPEPLPPGHALYTHPRVRLTPHIAWAAGDVVGTSTRKFLGNLARFLDSQALDDVFDPVRGY